MSLLEGSAVHDPERLAALEATGLLDAERDRTFDRLTRLASRVLATPISVMSLVGADRQFFASETGVGGEAAQRRGTPLSHSFCAHVVAHCEPLIVVDAREDDRV